MTQSKKQLKNTNNKYCIQYCKTQKFMISNLYDNLLNSKKRLIKKEIKYIPNKPGVYFLMCDSDVNFKTSARKSELSQYVHKSRLLNNKRVLYIGSSIHLMNRIDEYVKMIYRNGKKHKGGNGAKFLRNSTKKNLYFVFYLCPFELCEYFEKEELLEYINKNQCLPLFNRTL